MSVIRLLLKQRGILSHMRTTSATKSHAQNLFIPGSSRTSRLFASQVGRTSLV